MYSDALYEDPVFWGNLSAVLEKFARKRRTISSKIEGPSFRRRSEGPSWGQTFHEETLFIVCGL